ncbi:MAG: ThuA domain-containing protein [Halioglobus sp.]
MLKKALMTMSGLLLLLIVAGYFVLKSQGIIPRADYDHQAPALADFSKPAILVLSKANGFVHIDAIPAGKKMLAGIAAANDWDIYVTDNAATHNAVDLAKFKVVVWNNVSGDVLTPEQRAALKQWIDQGGAWVGIHASGGDPFYKWDWYVDTLIGAQFAGHTQSPQFQDADILVTDTDADITAHLPPRWTVSNEEWYAFDSNPRDKGYEILLTMDEQSYITTGGNFIWRDDMEGEHPIAWRHALGQGRVLYSAIGHQGATYDVPEFQQLITNAIRWAGKF